MRKMTKYHIWKETFLVLCISLLFWKDTTFAIHCKLCAEENANSTMPYYNAPNNRHLFSNNPVKDNKSCLDLANDAFDFTFVDEQCTDYYQLIGYSLCDCSGGIPNDSDNECSFCVDGSDIDDESYNTLWFEESSGATTTCGEVAEYVKRFNSTQDQCSQFQLGGAAKCGCRVVPNGCTLCQDGSEPTNPDFIVDPVLGLTCEQLAQGTKLSSPNSSQCMESQFLGALYCGCPYELPESRFCHLCSLGDDVSQPELPFFPGESTFTCGEMEIMAAYDESYANNYTCRESQVIANVFCGCQRQKSPSVQPTTVHTLSPSHSPSVTPPSSITNSPTIPPSTTPSFVNNCTALRLGIIPITTPQNAELSTITLNFTLALRQEYSVDDIRDDLRAALQTKIGPIVAGCDENDENEGILYVKFKNIDELGEQIISCPQTQNCPIVSFTIDVVSSKIGTVMRNGNRRTLSSLEKTFAKSVIGKDSQYSTRMLQNTTNEKAAEEKIKRIILENVNSLNVPGLLSMTATNDDRSTNGANRPVKIYASSTSIPPWSYALMSIAGVVFVSCLVLWYRQIKNNGKLCPCHNQKEENRKMMLPKKDKAFIKSDDDVSTSSINTKIPIYVAESLEAGSVSPIHISKRDIMDDRESTEEAFTCEERLTSEFTSSSHFKRKIINKRSISFENDSSNSQESASRRDEFPTIEVIKRHSFSNSFNREYVVVENTVLL